MIFKRKKKKLENFNALGLINDFALPLTPFGGKITNSDVVLICIDRIASQCAKLKPANAQSLREDASKEAKTESSRRGTKASLFC